jgi:transposase
MFMRTPGTAAELERRRRLAVERVLEGHSQQEVAEFLGVAKSSVSEWMKAYRAGGGAALASKPHPGRPPRLNKAQERQVLSWFRRSPTEFGFGNELWTAKRAAQLIRRKFGVDFHPRYVCEWLSKRRITPQKPRRQPRERDEKSIVEWKAREWPRLQNAPRGAVRISF